MKQDHTLGGWGGVCTAVIANRLHPEVSNTKTAAEYPAYWRSIEKRTSSLMGVIDKFAVRCGRRPDNFSELFPTVRPADYSGVLRQYEKIFAEWQRQTAEDRMQQQQQVTEDRAEAVITILSRNYLSWETLVSARLGGLILTPEEAGGRLDYYRRGAYPRAKKIENVNIIMDAIESHISKNGCLPVAFQDIESLLPRGHKFTWGEGYVIFNTWVGLTRVQNEQ